MAYDRGDLSELSDEEEYVSVYSEYNAAMGCEVPVYTFNPNYKGSARKLHKADWIRLRQAIALSKAHLVEDGSDDVVGKLVRALRAASIIAIHANVSRTDVLDHDGGAKSQFARAYRYVYAAQWANSTVDIDEDSVNLADGAPLSDILLNKKDVYYWLRARSDPNGSIQDDPEYQRRRDQRLYEIGNPNVRLKFDQAAPTSRKGGAPTVYLWEKACVWLMVHCVYSADRGQLTSQSTQADIGRLLRTALNEVGPLADPSDSLVSEHAKFIHETFQNAE